VVILCDTGLKCDDRKYYILAYLDDFVFLYSKLIGWRAEGRKLVNKCDHTSYTTTVVNN
jgi:hypothetical protein